MIGELFAITWKPNGGKSKWIWAVYPSLRYATQVAHSHVASDGGGTWEVYSTREVSKGKSVQSVLDRVLVKGSA